LEPVSSFCNLKERKGNGGWAAALTTENVALRAWVYIFIFISFLQKVEINQADRALPSTQSAAITL